MKAIGISILLMQLHIGGTQTDPDWKIFNIQPGPHVDFVGNAADLSQFESGSVRRIYASHVLEHFDYQTELRTVLKEWFRVLMPEGSLMISVPNLPVLCQLYVSKGLTPDQRFHIMRMMFGGQVDAYDFHKVGLSWEHLGSLLNAIGFQIAYPVENFGVFEDCSSLQYLGVPISLNVEAVK